MNLEDVMLKVKTGPAQQGFLCYGFTVESTHSQIRDRSRMTLAQGLKAEVGG